MASSAGGLSSSGAAAGDDAEGGSSEMQLGEGQMIETENPVGKAEPEDELPRTAAEL
jgi:hypothetical protein